LTVVQELGWDWFLAEEWDDRLLCWENAALLEALRRRVLEERCQCSVIELVSLLAAERIGIVIVIVEVWVSGVGLRGRSG
jgi:hypothetical protein